MRCAPPPSKPLCEDPMLHASICSWRPRCQVRAIYGFYYEQCVNYQLRHCLQGSHLLHASICSWHPRCQVCAIYGFYYEQFVNYQLRHCLQGSHLLHASICSWRLQSYAARLQSYAAHLCSWRLQSCSARKHLLLAFTILGVRFN